MTEKISQESIRSMQPVLITGPARSGTSLLLQLMRYITNCTVFTHSEYNPKELDAYGVHHQNVFGNFLASAIYKKYLIIKSPFGFWEEDVKYTFEELFDSNWKVISLIRDPRDVAVSRNPFKENFEYVWRPYSWVRTAKSLIKWNGHKDLFIIKYEDLVQDHKRQLQFVADFLREELVSGYEDFYKGININSWKPLNGPRPIDPHSVGRWKLEDHAEHLKEAMTDEIKELAKEFGYNI